jgi:cellulose synthase/poly-beta-1,6-N-acetylglucosamine synthase-like glycosyltransferase
VTEALFWLAVAALAYTFAGYPALMLALARLRPRPVARAPREPAVSVLIAVHDEVGTIAARVENCLALDYPQDRLEIVIASDGSTDGTVDVARRHARASGAGPIVRVVAYPWRRGKPSVLNDTVPHCTGEIVVLGDARQRYEPDAVRRLVENFADPSVGAVSGELMLRNDAGLAVGEGVGAYWRYEKLIRRAESAVHSTVGATGAIYAIRRRLFAPIPADTLVDDVLVPLRVVRQGFRVVFDGRARAWDRVAASAREESTRKVRTIGGVLQLFARERWLWAPTHPVWLQAISHKLLRLTAPFFMLAALLTSVVLAPAGGVYAAALAAQLAFYAAAAAGALTAHRSGRLARLLAMPHAFCLLNLVTLVSLGRYLTGRQTVRWQKAAEAARTEAA